MYNGNKLWRTSLTLEDLIVIPELLHECLPHIPAFRYYPIIENELNPEILEKMIRMIASVCLLETGDDAIFYKTIESIMDLVHIDTEKGQFLLKRRLFYWLLDYFQSHGIVSIDETTTGNFVTTPQETNSMSAQRLKRIKEMEWKKVLIREFKKELRKELCTAR